MLKYCNVKWSALIPRKFTLCVSRSINMCLRENGHLGPVGGGGALYVEWWTHMRVTSISWGDYLIFSKRILGLFS